MGDLERVRAWIEAGRLLPPSTELPNTVDLARVLAERCGVDDAPASAAGAAIADAIPPAEHYVFVLVDGLGLELLERAAAARRLPAPPASAGAAGGVPLYDRGRADVPGDWGVAR